MGRQVERRTHTKSRKGCLHCKKRHVKCNEIRPQCGRCERLEIDCTWPVKKLESEPLKEDTPCKHDDVVLGAAPDFLNVRDLKLLHYWFLNTSLTCAQTGQQYLWQTSIPELGFRHHFLLRGLLATAAVHKAAVYHDETPDLLLQSSQHMDIAIATFREHLIKPDPATCVPVVALACLLVMHRLGLAQVQTPTDPIEELCVLARLSRGIKPTANDYWGRILSSEMGPMIRNITDEVQVGRPFPEVLQLKDFVLQRDHLSAEFQRDCIDAIESLHDTFANVRRYPHEADQVAIGRIFSWTASLLNGVLDGVQRREPAALLIVAYFAALIRSGDRVWYLRNWARWLLDAVEGELGGGEGEGWLEWPRREIGGLAAECSF